ncbi:PREDICTED: F-box/FBD/LRR-repeat protein At1g13570-like [Nicotiana attenuata]|uniref:F-box/FBD/LRR-repeat protein At1g13570-like n=1 Tax=Nicotiana attenuata TaxID=49451 RepID=UPI0009048C39|nr:PREDICTED: F-box/FBD/LRR-repeat protein At1g13570-like [Nicotiana attenuata]
MMPPHGKRQHLPPLKVFSDLPDSVIDDILMRLPLRDAVRTSILSKKWRYNWCRLPQLTVDETLWQTTKDLISPTIKFTNIIYHLLALHTGPICKFILSISDRVNCPKIDNLICFLSRNGIQHLVLQLPFRGNLYKLPSSFFTCSQLRHLVLRQCLIRSSPLFKGFDRLISLELGGVTISSEFLGSLISKCPLLENLVLKHVDTSNPTEISALKLRSFVFIGNIHLIDLKIVPLLSKITYEPTEFSVEAGYNLAKIFESIPALEHLSWSNYNFQVDDAGPAEVIPTRLPSALNSLKRLYLSWITLGEFFEFSFALCLIRSSPYIEEIEIEGCVDVDGEYYEPVPRDAVDEIPASFSDMTFYHLRTVKIKSLAGADAEMQLIKVLLAKSPMLVRMVIEPYELEESLKAEITKFQRASSKAEIVYSVD